MFVLLTCALESNCAPDDHQTLVLCRWAPQKAPFGARFFALLAVSPSLRAPTRLHLGPKRVALSSAAAPLSQKPEGGQLGATARPAVLFGAAQSKRQIQSLGFSALASPHSPSRVAASVPQVHATRLATCLFGSAHSRSPAFPAGGH